MKSEVKILLINPENGSVKIQHGSTIVVGQRGAEGSKKMRRRFQATRAIAVLLAMCMMVLTFGAQAFARPGDEELQNRAKRIAQKTKTEQVKTIWWKAKVSKKTKVTTLGTSSAPSEKLVVAKGTTVTVVQRDYHIKAGISECMLPDGGLCWIPNRSLKFKKPIVTAGEGDYDKKTKEAFVNGEGGISATATVPDKLIWISLDKQRVNVFQGSIGRWKLIQEFPCSTGKVDAPTFDQTFKKLYRAGRKDPSVSYGTARNLKWYTFVYGYGMHMWNRKGRNMIGLAPLSHSCIRMKKEAALWIYDDANIPVGTRIYVW